MEFELDFWIFEFKEMLELELKHLKVKRPEAHTPT
jgi:hypothetical protein